jgi:hypothetical protein
MNNRYITDLTIVLFLDTFFLQWRQNICHVLLHYMRCLMKENPVLNFKINTISYVVNLINFINITLIYHITKQRVCETISIINMLTTCKQNLGVAPWRRIFSRLNVLFICYGTAVEHRSLLNRSGICDGINCCNMFLFMQPFWA